MYQIQHIDSSIATRYEKFTFPCFRQLLRQKPQDSIVAGAASCFGMPAGLVLAEVTEGGQTGKIHSLFVVPRFRNLGFGKELLLFAEDKLQKKGCARLETSFISEGSSTPPIKNILSKYGWGEPELIKELNTIDSSLAREGWLYRYHFPANYTVTPWSNISPAKLVELKVLENKWYPSYVSPFREHPIGIHLSTSFWLCHQEEIVGWVITRQSAPDTLHYSTLFVREELQGTGRGVQLLAEAIKTTKAHFPFGSYILLHTAS